RRGQPRRQPPKAAAPWRPPLLPASPWQACSRVAHATPLASPASSKSSRSGRGNARVLTSVRRKGVSAVFRRLQPGESRRCRLAFFPVPPPRRPPFPRVIFLRLPQHRVLLRLH